MSLSAPTQLTLAFAQNGVFTPIPNASQITITPGAASYNDGFPPVTRIPVAAGGTPPYGEDMNGILNALSTSVQWCQAGAGYIFSAAFAAAVGGYPIGAVVQASDGLGHWMNTLSGNTSNPETAATPNNWQPIDRRAVTPITALTGVIPTVTLTNLQGANDIITLAGTLTASVVLILPTYIKTWKVVNNAVVGAFTITMKTAAGTGVVIAGQAGAVTELYGDGTNINGGGTAGRLLNIQTFVASGTYTPTPGTNSIIAEVQAPGGGTGGVPAQASGSGALSQAASAGSYIKARITSGFSGLAITIGAQGAAGTSTTTGGNGGTTSLGSLLSCPGGLGGVNGGGSTIVTVVPPANPPAAPTATGSNVQVINFMTGSAGGMGINMASGGVGQGGNGGPSGIGGSPGSGGKSGAGNIGNPPGYGAGAGGAYIGASGSLAGGATGGQGIVVIYEYS